MRHLKTYEDYELKKGGNIKPSLTKLSNGDEVDVYHQRTTLIIDVKKLRGEWDQIDLPVSDKDKARGVSRRSIEEGDKILKEINKLIGKIYPKEDYIGRYVRVTGDRKNSVTFAMQCVDSETFKEDLEKGIEEILADGPIMKYVLGFRESDDKEFFSKRFFPSR